MKETEQSTCRVGEHNFMPKRQTAINAGTKGQYNDISELFCTRCGLVMFLQGSEEIKPRISLARPS